MSTAPVAPPQREVVTLLTLQRDLYSRLRGLSEQQRNLIETDRPEVLLQILTERQSIVNRLARLNEQLAPMRRTWDVTFAALPPETRSEVTGLLAEINTLLRSILTSDESDTAMLAARKHAIGSELQAIESRRSVAGAYSRSAGPASTSADLSG